MKIVYNACFGGFSLSEAGMLRYAELKGLTLYPERGSLFTTYWKVPPGQRVKALSGKQWAQASMEERIAQNEAESAQILSCSDLDRTDPVLVQVVEELGDAAASGRSARLQIEDVPNGTRYRIDEYDGRETIMTIDDYEWEVAK